MNSDAREENTNNSTARVECPNGDSACGYLREIIQLREEVVRLNEQNRTDALTGLYNFRFFNEVISIEMERTRRSGQTMALILLDVDHFKSFNDRLGHEAGNTALRHISRLIAQTVRKLDMACRFGGEEFVIILPDTELGQAVQVAERLREALTSAPIAIEDNEPVLLTLSAGVDTYTPMCGGTADSLLRRVDAWLYQAKHQGRNRVAHPVPEQKTAGAAVTPEEKAALLGSAGR